MHSLRILRLLPFLALLALRGAEPSAPRPEEAFPPLPVYNLNFPGGTPGQLVTAMTAASGKPVNLVIAEELANVRIPPVQVNQVTTPMLLGALNFEGSRLTDNGQRLENYHTDFQIAAGSNPRDPNAIWCLRSSDFRTGIVARFYLLSKYLEAGLSVDDITTAIQTAWKMTGAEDLPKLSYHKETNLLIVVGPTPEIPIVESVLRELDKFHPEKQPSSPAPPKT